jgi:hypothetical protein
MYNGGEISDDFLFHEIHHIFDRFADEPDNKNLIFAAALISLMNKIDKLEDEIARIYRVVNET